jgi:hypothetical protein
MSFAGLRMHVILSVAKNLLFFLSLAQNLLFFARQPNASVHAP